MQLRVLVNTKLLENYLYWSQSIRDSDAKQKESLDAVDKALEILEKVTIDGLPSFICSEYPTIDGLASFVCSEYAKLGQLEKAGEIVTRIQDHYWLADSHVNFSRAYASQGKAEMAEEYYKKAVHSLMLEKELSYQDYVFASVSEVG
jgi:tetratricopeptide (TPR) repeat protein